MNVPLKLTKALHCYSVKKNVEIGAKLKGKFYATDVSAGARLRAPTSALDSKERRAAGKKAQETDADEDEFVAVRFFPSFACCNTTSLI